MGPPPPEEWVKQRKQLKGSEILGLKSNGFGGRHPFSPEKEYKVKLYDFRRPDKFSRDQIRTLQMMHETFSRLVSTSLSAMLRSLVSVKVASVDQLTFEEFVQAIPNPTNISVINMDPLRGSAILEIDPELNFAAIDRLFGGRGASFGTNRELTDIELSILEGLITRMLPSLGEAWSNVIGLKPRLATIETNPQFAQIVPPNNMVVLISFETVIGEAKGFINLCIPYITIEPVMDRLSAQYWFSSIMKDKEPDPAIVAGLKTDVKFSIEAGTLPLAEARALKSGSMLKLSGSADQVRLVSGGASVLVLKKSRDQKSGRIEYRVVEEESAVSVDRLDGIISSSRESEPAHAVGDMLAQSLKGLTQEIKGMIDGLKKDVESLKGRQAELVDRIGLSGEDTGDHAVAVLLKPFDLVRQADAKLLYTFIAAEHPQTIAMVLSQLDKVTSARILAMMDEKPDARMDIVGRIAQMERISPDVLREVERVIEHKLKATSKEDLALSGGVDTVVELLNLSNRGVEKSVIEALEKARPELAEEIKKRMFVFEDIAMLDVRTIRKVIDNVPVEDLVLALKPAAAGVKDFILANCEKSRADAVRQTLEKSGPVRLSEAEKAQQKIVNIIRKLEDAGEIVVARADEQVV
jgi:flagellar motor switch protein FliM